MRDYKKTHHAYELHTDIKPKGKLKKLIQRITRSKLKKKLEKIIKDIVR